MAEKKSFMLYYDYREHLALLTDEERGKLLMALLDYAELGEIDELDGAARMAFSFIRAQIDRDDAKYAETIEKRRIAGRQGGRPEKQKVFEESTEKQEKAKKANGFSEKQTKAKKADTVTDTDTDTVTDTDIPPKSPTGDKKSKTPKNDALERKKEAKKEKTAKFDIFWAAYPKKTAKPAALNAFLKIDPSEELLETMLAAIKRQQVSEQWSRENGKYIPYPATWLNQQRWGDEIEPAKPKYQSDASYNIGEMEDYFLHNTPVYGGDDHE